jgi:transcriptional regulator with XRE-family HTH domain
MSSSKNKKALDEITLRVAENFKRLRKKMGWTLQETARRSNPPVTFQYIGHVENCNTGLGKRARKKWAKIFNVDVSEFYKPLNTDEDMSEFLQPLDKSENKHDREIRLLIQEAQKYGDEKIKRLRQLMPILLGGEGLHVTSGGDKKKLSNRRDALDKAFAEINIKDLAFKLKTSPGVLYNIKYGLRRVGATRAIKIEKATEGKISRAVLRPDIFGN